jgi:large subunit ribosomal protein L23
VHRQANKIEIGKAVEIVFGVRVDKVRTLVMRGDTRRVGRFYGKTRQWKKAMVTLHPGDSIDFYGED